MTQAKKQTPQPLPELPVVTGFETGKAIARMMNNPALWWQALVIFHAHYEHWEETWHVSQAASESERKCVHAIRSSAVNVGAERLAAAAALENALINLTYHPQNLTPLRARVLACFLEVRQSAQAALDLPDRLVES